MKHLATILVTGLILLWFLPLILAARIIWAIVWLVVIAGWATWYIRGKKSIEE